MAWRAKASHNDGGPKACTGRQPHRQSDAERQHHTEHERSQSQLQCRGQALQYEVERRGALAQRYAEIPTHRIGEEFPVLHDPGLVESERGAQPRNVFIAGFHRQQQRGRIAREAD